MGDRLRSAGPSAPARRGAARPDEGLGGTQLPLGGRFPASAFSAEDNKWNAVHHPFTRPQRKTRRCSKKGEYAGMRAVAYDVVLNGVEIGGGIDPNSRAGVAGEAL